MYRNYTEIEVRDVRVIDVEDISRTDATSQTCPGIYNSRSRARAPRTRTAHPHAPAHQNCTGAFYNGIFIIPFLQWNLNVTDPEFDFGCTKYHLVNLLSLNQHGTDRYFLEWNLCGFFLSGTFYNGIDFGPVLSTIEFIWYLFRYFLQWNLYGTFSGTFYNGIYMAPALSGDCGCQLRNALQPDRSPIPAFFSSGTIYTSILIYIDLQSIRVKLSCFYNDNYLQFW